MNSEEQKLSLSFPVRVLLVGIAFYRRVFSPILHGIFGPDGFCRFTPTCSEYARQALIVHGFFRGCLLAVWRILRCNPFCNGGADPVPPQGRWRNRHEKIGIFGGSFDPIHNAHLRLAEAARDALGLDRVIFVPASQSPLKEDSPIAAGGIRLEMLNAAIASSAGFETSEWELLQGGKSYSIDTARHFSKKFPFAELYWILGADQLVQLDKWRDIEELSKIVRFAVMCRDGDTLPSLPSELARFVSVEPLALDPIDLSSTSVREKIPELDDSALEAYLPKEVVKIIRNHKLYTKS